MIRRQSKNLLLMEARRDRLCQLISFSLRFTEQPDTASESANSDKDSPEEYLSFPGNRGKKSKFRIFLSH
jgi:hypothetical protein